MAANPPIPIDSLSVTSLYLKLYANGNQLSTATGFVVAHEGRHYLVTNWHVFAGRHPDTLEPLSRTAGIPDEVRIAHEVENATSTMWQFVREPLVDAAGAQRWIAHPRGQEVDVAVLELRSCAPPIILHPLNLALADFDMRTYPSMPVSIVGFPLGLRATVFFAIWKTGHIASEPEIPYMGRPAFLIDAGTHHGMSGSPVFARQAGAYMSSAGLKVTPGIHTRFLGVYASRLHPPEAELGCVWRPNAIREVLQHALGAIQA